MAQIIVRNLDEAVKRGLRERAVRNGKSMEEEARDVLRAAVEPRADVGVRLGTRIAARFAGIGLDGDIDEFRGEAVRPADFSR
jgi:plasmid stability protein